MNKTWTIGRIVHYRRWRGRCIPAVVTSTDRDNETVMIFPPEGKPESRPAVPDDWHWPEDCKPKVCRECGRALENTGSE